MKKNTSGVSHDVLIARRRKLRCGGFSALLTALVVCAALLMCYIGDALEKKYALSLDLSFNSSTTQSATTDTVLRSLKSDVELYLIASKGSEDRALGALLNRYAARTSHLSLSEENVLKNPSLTTRFADILGDNAVSTDCLIVYSKVNNRARVLTQNDYYTYTYDMTTGAYSPASLNYDKAVTEAILYVSTPKLPLVQILTGHGELTATDTATMEDALIAANYNVERVDISQNPVHDDAVLMILSPQIDLTDEELRTLTAFAEDGGRFLIVSQYADPASLENFNTLYAYFGITPYPGLVIAKESDTDSYYTDATVYLMPYMQKHPSTDAIIAAGLDILLTPLSRAFDVSTPPKDVTLTPLLVTGQAYIRNIGDDAGTSDQQATDPEGTFTVAMLAEHENADSVARAFVIGSATTFTDYWIQSYTASDEFLLNILYYLQEESPVDLDILPKDAVRAPLSLGSLTGAVIAVVLLPLAVLLVAAFVLMPRKNL